MTSPLRGEHRSIEERLAELERKNRKNEGEHVNFLEMLRQAAHMISRYLDRALGYTDSRRQPQRQKKPHRDD